MAQLADALFTVTQKNVLGLLYGQSDRSFYTREILQKTGMGVATIKRELDRMVLVGILTKSKVGNQHHYQANPDCPIFVELSNIVFKTIVPETNRYETMDLLVENNRQKILSAARKNGVRNVRVFGSMARNDANDESDLDLLVELEEGKSGFALGGFLEDVSNLVHRKVDVVTEKSLHPSIRDKVLLEARTL